MDFQICVENHSAHDISKAIDFNDTKTCFKALCICCKKAFTILTSRDNNRAKAPETFALCGHFITLALQAKYKNVLIF